MNKLCIVPIAAALAGLAGCQIIGPDGGGGGAGGGIPTDIIFKSLDKARVPLKLLDDGDKKDVKRKDRVKYKPATGGDSPKKRYKMSAKKDGAAATEQMERAFAGHATIWVRVAIDKTKGLVDGESCAFLRRAEGGGQVLQVEAVWNEAIDGFTARARVDGVLAGTTADYPAQQELFLMIESGVIEMSLSAAPAISGEHNGYGVPSVLHTTPSSTKDSFRGGFGVCGLAEKGAFYFAELCARMSSNPSTGDENKVANELVKALINVNYVLLLISFPPPHNVQTITPLVGSTDLFTFLALEELKQAEQAGTLEPETDVKAVRKSIKEARSHLIPAVNKALKLFDNEKDNAKSLQKKLEAADEHLRVAMGQLHGFLGTTRKQLDKTVKIIP